MFKKNSIVITNSLNKTKLLQENQSLLNIKIYTINEFNNLYYFNYDEKACLFIMENYNVNYEISKIYLNNLYYINNQNYNDPKLDFLVKLKNDLFQKNLLKENKLFKKTLTNKNIIFYNLYITKELQNIINELSFHNNVTVINEEETSYNHPINELSNIEDEVVYVANNIVDLLKQGVNPQKIFLTNLNDDYYKLINRIFPMFKIPYNIQEKKSIFGTKICTSFLHAYSNDLNKTLATIEPLISSDEDEDIYNKIINILNDYTFTSNKENIKKIIKYRLKNTYITNKKLTNAVNEISLYDHIATDEYVFLLSFNQGIIPNIYKDEDYLNDYQKNKLNISITVDKNINTRTETKDAIKRIKNLIITYKKQANGEEFNISNLNEELQYPINKIDNLPLLNSNLHNQIKLTSLLDEYYKYGTNSSLLNTLYNHYNNIKYKTYNNIFTGIEKTSLNEYLDNKLTLSYTDLNNYYKCPFSYYIGKILKLDIYEETFAIIIGNIFHAILEKYSKNSLSYDELWTQTIASVNYNFSPKEKFLLEKLKKELAFAIDVIKQQEQFTNLHDELHEERIYTSISGDMKITFTGVIDKIKYTKKDNDMIIAIIDYKTGTPHLELNTIPYGINMQLPIYIYLAKNSKKLTNIKIAGFYLQKILSSEITVDNFKDYEQEKKKRLRLEGYSNEDLSILSEFDNSYMDSNIIKSMKITKDNNFAHFAKVLSTKQMDQISQLVEKKITEGATKICNAEFSIAPKKINNKIYGCDVCKFKDICFHTNNDFIELKELTEKDVFGGENNGLD